MEVTQVVDINPHHSQLPDGSASDHDLTLIEQQANLHGSTQSYLQGGAFEDLTDSVLCATLVGSGAFADDKSYYCGISTIGLDTAVEDMAQLWDVSMDLSEYPAVVPLHELEINSHDQQIDSLLEQASSYPSLELSYVVPLFTSSMRQHGSLAFDVTPPSLRHVQEKLAKTRRNFSGSSSNTPDGFNFNALGITPWSPSHGIPNDTPPWTDLHALEFHPMFYSPKSRATLSVMRASCTYPYGLTYTPSLSSSDTAVTPPIDSMVKQKIAAQERRPAAPSALVTSPPSPWFPIYTGGSPALTSSSLSRQLFEKLLRESSSPRPVAVSSLFKESFALSTRSHGSPSSFFSPELGKETNVLLPPACEVASESVAMDCTEGRNQGGTTAHATIGTERHQIIIPSSVSADGTLLRLLRHRHTDLTVKPAPKEMRTIAVQTDPAHASIIQATESDQTVSAIRIVALRSVRSLASEPALADQADVGNSTMDPICPWLFSPETRCDGEVKQITQGSIIGRLVRFVFGR